MTSAEYIKLWCALLFEHLSTFNCVYLYLFKMTAVLYCAHRCIMSPIPLHVTATIWPSVEHWSCQSTTTMLYRILAMILWISLSGNFVNLYAPSVNLFLSPPNRVTCFQSVLCPPSLIPLWLRWWHPSLNSIIAAETGRQFSLSSCNPCLTK